MSEPRLERPLDPAAVRTADAAFYERHPERNGRPISRGEPNYDELSAEWREMYMAAGGPVESEDDAWASPTRAPEAVQEPCPLEAIRIVLCYDAKEFEPFPSEPYEMVLSSGEERQDAMGSDGMVTITGIPAGTCRIRFTGWKSPSP